MGDVDLAIEISMVTLNEIEAVEACRWLQEAGFPQYAQVYKDGQFPVDIEAVEKDHDFLDKEDLESLFRRLHTLNKCAIMKINTPTRKEAEDSDEEDECALSDKWRYQRSSRRWSKVDEDVGQRLVQSSLSNDSLLADQTSSSEMGDTSPVLDTRLHHPDTLTTDIHSLNNNNINTNNNRDSPTAREANNNASLVSNSKKSHKSTTRESKKGAKSFLKRMESLKSNKWGHKSHRTISEISSPVIMNNDDMQAKIKLLNCRDIEPSVNNVQTGNGGSTDDSLSSGSKTSTHTTMAVRPTNFGSDETSRFQTTPVRAGSFSQENSPVGVLPRTVNHTARSSLSDVELATFNGALSLLSDGGLSDSETELSDTVFPTGEFRLGRFPSNLDETYFPGDSPKKTRPRSYSDMRPDESSRVLRRVSHDPEHKANRVSIYDNVPIEEDLSVAQQELDIILCELFENINGLNRTVNGDDAEVLAPPQYLNHRKNGGFGGESSRMEDEEEGEGGADTEQASPTSHQSRGDTDAEILSGMFSSPDSSDQELTADDRLSQDDSSENIGNQERRDSGVGSSLTRTSSDRRKYRIRWHSFHKSHRPTSESGNVQIASLSAGQLLMLRKLSLLKLTALIEKYTQSRNNWIFSVTRFMKRHKVPDYRDKNVFGVPFTVMIQRTGQALPQCILYAMRFLRRTAGDAIGIFRKSGVRSRIQKLRNEIEAEPEGVDFEDMPAYDVADLLKQYFRELPECLLSNKLSDIFISLFLYVPPELRVDAMQAAVVLMPDENRDVLQSLLLFLSDIAKLADEHQMTASNLAVCLAPSLFNMGGSRSSSQAASPRRNRKSPGIPDPRELMEQKAAHECLTLMIQECKKLFTVPAGTLSKCRCWHGDPVPLSKLNSCSGDDTPGYKAYIDSCIQGLLKESREKFRGWVSVSVGGDVDLAYKKVGDEHPLRLWKCSVDVEAPPTEVLHRVLNERQKWDDDLLQWSTVEKLDENTEIFQYVRNSMAPHPTREFCVLRSWQTDLPRGACMLVSTSVEHPKAELKGGLRAIELASRYLIEPSGAGKSRLTHLSRVDIRGHSPDWYKKVYGHICVNFMEKIRVSLKQSADGPETKV